MVKKFKLSKQLISFHEEIKHFINGLYPALALFSKFLWVTPKILLEDQQDSKHNWRMNQQNLSFSAIFVQPVRYFGKGV